MCKWVVNQDRDIIIKIDNISELHIVYIYYESTLIAFNLNYNSILLGTFDSIQECMIEFSRIINSLTDFYIISGYSE